MRGACFRNLATILFRLVLRLAFRYGLPLHVGGIVRSAALQGRAVIDDVAGTCAGLACRAAGLLPLNHRTLPPIGQRRQRNRGSTIEPGLLLISRGGFWSAAVRDKESGTVRTPSA